MPLGVNARRPKFLGTNKFPIINIWNLALINRHCGGRKQSSAEPEPFKPFSICHLPKQCQKAQAKTCSARASPFFFFFFLHLNLCALVTMVFDGCAPLVWRWNGYVPWPKSRSLEGVNLRTWCYASLSHSHPQPNPSRWFFGTPWYYTHQLPSIHSKYTISTTLFSESG